MEYLYRGVSARHPAWFAASMGIVIPGDPFGLSTPAEHNEGGVQILSPYTSWTRSRTRAEFFRDREGPGGVLLRVETNAPVPGDIWFWEYSIDIFFEDEVLLHGIRIGVEVIA